MILSRNTFIVFSNTLEFKQTLSETGIQTQKILLHTLKALMELNINRYYTCACVISSPS